MSAEISNTTLTKEAKAFHLKKRLGQHFLIDVDTLDEIVDALDARPGETVVEVGPGIGFLTRLLVQKDLNIIGVDLDRESIERLESFRYPNTQIKHGDFLQFDLNNMDFFRRKREAEDAAEQQPPAPSSRMKVIGNVPYQITGLIIGHLLGELDKPSPWLQRIDNIVLTVQFEVARRMVAHAGDEDYSRVSILVEQYAKAQFIKKVPASAFYPPPNVNSAIVKLIPRKEPLVKSKNMTLMRQLIQAGFRQRRKMYRNAVSFLRLPQPQIDAVFASLGLDPQVRAERLSLKQFAMLADAFDEIAVNAQVEDVSAGEDQSEL